MLEMRIPLETHSALPISGDKFPLGTLVGGSSVHHVQKALGEVVKCK